MRAVVLVASSLIGVGVHAQDWALINPAYKYNYSIGNGDTIVHQIRVDLTEAIAADSFRYELNKVAEPCAGCNAGCDLRMRIPQFLMAECRFGAVSWRFTGPGDLVVHPQASLGEQWTFDLVNGTMGAVSEVTEEPVFGIMDSVRTMTTTMNDTVRWSKHYGIIRWHLSAGSDYRLVGVHGPMLGELIPSPEHFFPFQVGDVVQTIHYSNSNQTGSATYRRLHIQQRTETGNGLVFSCWSYYRHNGDNGIFISAGQGPYEWHIDSASIPGFNILFSSPQEIMNHGEIGPFSSPGELNAWAVHKRLASGAYEIKADSAFGVPIFLSVGASPDDCAPRISAGWVESVLRYDTRGLSASNFCSGTNWYGFSTYGAIINGDTVGTLHDDGFFHVGLDDEQVERIYLHPNPASEWIVLSPVTQNKVRSIFDVQGRLVFTHIPTAATEPLDVRSLPAGSYVLRIDGHKPERLIIAR